MEPQLNSQPIDKKVKLDFKDSKYATGRRKKSIAKVWVKKRFRKYLCKWKKNG